MKTLYEKAKYFMFRCARPLDLARWRYHFMNGEQDAVLFALSHYQNEDGGFGHTLEADAWNPNSTPIQTWAATEILREINYTDANHPLVKNLLTYLASGQDFTGKTWRNTVASNNDYPHAPWWTWSEETEEAQRTSYNPTASLAGFIIRFANPKSELFELGQRVADEAIEAFMSRNDLVEMHELACFVRLLEYADEAEVPFSLTAFKPKLQEQVQQSITQDTALWDTSYICKPSQFINGPESAFYETNQAIVSFECNHIRTSQKTDGTWPLPWDWRSYPEEWPLSRNWWHANIIIQNMLFLKNFSEMG